MTERLTREQVEVMLTGLVQDKVDGVTAQRLLDHYYTQRDEIATLAQRLQEQHDTVPEVLDRGIVAATRDALTKGTR